MVENNPVLKNMVDLVIPIGHGLIHHPITHCTILMQLGYEPDPPYYGHNLLSLISHKPKILKYPSILTYSKRVAEKVGWAGLLFIGLPAHLCYINLSNLITDSIYEHITSQDKGKKNTFLNTDRPFKEYVSELTIVAGAKISGVLLAYPFEVIMIRQMAEIMEENGVGSSSILTWVMRIFKEEGLAGFYGGISSKLTGEILTAFVAGSLVYAFNNYFLSKSTDEMKDYSPLISKVVASTLFHKFNVIAAVLAVSGSGLACAIPVTGFYDAYKVLRGKNAFNRGSSMFNRTAY